MENIKVTSWENCQKVLKEIEENRNELSHENVTSVSNLIYRGHADSRWHLATTLERFASHDLSVEEYYRIISIIKSQIETLTGKVWDLPNFPDLTEWLTKADMFMARTLPGYEYMIYLRHTGFPSPLLDWTRLPFVAAYFAFKTIPPQTEYVSIYAYMEHAGHGKSHDGGKPLISSLGPYVRTHKRHWLQQSQYTICTIESEEGLCYACHEEVFSDVPEKQDVLWKIDIPASDSLIALHDLEKMNINAFLLFGSEESLMETVAMHEFHFRSNFP